MDGRGEGEEMLVRPAEDDHALPRFGKCRRVDADPGQVVRRGLKQVNVAEVEVFAEGELVGLDSC